MGLFGTKRKRELLDWWRKTVPEIDVQRRYDVYLRLQDGPPLVIRNVAFKGQRRLPSDATHGVHEYALVQQEDGVEVYVSSIHIFVFCEHGAKPNVQVQSFGQ